MKKNGNKGAAEKTPYSKYISDFFGKRLQQQKICSTKTIDVYKTGVKHYFQYRAETAHLPVHGIYFEDIDYDGMLDFRNYMYDELKYAERTCNLFLAANKSYIDYAAMRDIALQPVAYAVHQVPGLRVPITHQPIIENEIGLATFLASPPHSTLGVRDMAILSTLYDGALRGAELIGLLYGDVTWGESVSLVVHGKGRKERVVWLSQETSALLRQYRTLYHGGGSPNPLRPFFYTIRDENKPMSMRNLERLTTKYGDKSRELLRQTYGEDAKNMLPDKITPHTLRRTRATLLLRDNAPIEQISNFLGHSDVSTTAKHYAFVSEEQMKELAKRAVSAIPNAEEGLETNDAAMPDGMIDSLDDELDKLFNF